MHLTPLRNKSKRERYEWLGDAVIHEVITRLMCLEAIEALDREGDGGKQLPWSLEHNLGAVIDLAVSNANLAEVYTTELPGLIAFLEMGEERLLHPGGYRPPPGMSNPSIMSTKGLDKRLPDLVESVIGEAFEASLQRKGRSQKRYRFSNGNRAATVDRLLAAALSSELVISWVISGRSKGLGACGREVALPPANRFAALAGSLGDDDDNGCPTAASAEVDPDPGGLAEDGASVAGTFSGDQCGVAQGKGTVGPDLSGGEGAPTLTHPLVLKHSISSTGRNRGGAEQGMLTNRQKLGVGVYPRCATPVSPCPENNEGPPTPTHVAHCSPSFAPSSSPRDARAGRRTVYQLFGASLLQFRVSIALYVSGPRGGGGQEGPRELTIKRQRIMCTENLEAVARKLCLGGDKEERSRATGAGGDEAANVPDTIAGSRQREGDKKMPQTTPHGGPRAMSLANTLRVAVGRTELTCPSDQTFTDHVVELLLSCPDSGRGSLPMQSPPMHSLLPPSLPPVEKKYHTPGETLPVAAAAAAMERSYTPREHSDDVDQQVREGEGTPRVCHNPWPVWEFPAAVGAAARLFVEPEREGVPGVGPSAPGRQMSSLQPPRIRKRKREERAPRCRGSRSPPSNKLSSLACPERYTSLVADLPGEERRLLARLSHHSYVKVLECILARFAFSSSSSTSASSAAPPSVAQEEPSSPPNRATAAHSSSFRCCTDPPSSPSPPPTPHLLTIDPTVPDTPPPEQPLSPAEVEQKVVSTRAEEDWDAVWAALLESQSHPSLTGLVEPMHLAKAGPDRLVLPIPNPFYRRVLHALCSVHGLRSWGGETCGERTGERGEGP
ncbi:unnamed protein product, partial [Discosporangium mesarthrocarpum]